MKTELKKKLSELRDFEDPRISLEQYMTPPALAADLVHAAYMRGDIDGREVVDLGAGTGMLAIGAALAGGEVTAVEKDPEAVRLARENVEDAGVEVELVEEDVEEFSGGYDTAVMNPPFSVHSDTGLSFWQRAVEVADAVYGISPRGARSGIKDFVESSSHEITGVEPYSISLPPTYGFHTEEGRETEVDLIVSQRGDK